MERKTDAEMHFCAVSLGCVHDDLRSEPGSWLVVGMIPIFNGKTARRAGRPTEGPEGTVRRKVHLFHQCYSKLLEGWNTITKNVKILQWADKVWRKSFILLGALMGDQPEADAFCGTGPQICKVCTCPKAYLCDKDPYPLRKASRVCKTVHRAADGRMTGRKLFERKKDGDVKHCELETHSCLFSSCLQKCTQGNWWISSCRERLLGQKSV